MYINTLLIPKSHGSWVACEWVTTLFFWPSISQEGGTHAQLATGYIDME